MPSVFRRVLWRSSGRYVFGLDLFGLVACALLVHALACAPAPAHGQSARATASADSVRIGERFTVSVVATHRFTTSVLFPPDTAGPSVFGDLEVVARSDVHERYLGTDRPGMRVDSIAFEVATFALDTARVPPLPVRFVMGGDTAHLRTAALRIPVQSTVSADAEGLRGMTSLAPFPGPWWPWALLALVAAVCIAGAVYFWRERRPSAPPAPQPPARPAPAPHQAARRRFDALAEQTDWNDPAALEAAFVELSTIVRRYLARRLGVAALERTTAELIRALRADAALPAAALDDVNTVLQQADLVKFADKRPTSAEGRAALRTARGAVDAIERALPPRHREAAPDEAAPDEAALDAAAPDAAAPDEATA